MKKVIIFGIEKFAEIVHFYLTHDSSYEIEAFTVDKKYIKKEKLLGLPVTPFEDIEINYPPEKYNMFIAIGYSNLNKTRADKYYKAKAKGYEFISYVCSKSIKWGDIQVGDNCFILEKQTIQPFVKIGNNVIMWSGVHISHHSTIGDHCFISPQVVINGNVKIKEYCFLGANATIRDGITIAKKNIIGAGALILKNTKEKEVYRGATAKLFSKDSFQIKL